METDSYENNENNYWPEINRLPHISPGKMGLFRISKELQFWVCNHDEPHAGPPAQGKEDAFIGRKRKFGGP